MYQKLTLFAIAGALMIVLLLACTQSAAPAPASAGKPGLEAAPPGQSQWDALAAAAAKEGEVMMYTSVSTEAKNAINDSFGKKYHVLVDFTVGTGAQISPKILTERGAGLFLADVINAGGTTLLQSLKPKDVFADIQPELVLAEVIAPNVWVAGKVPYIDRDRTTLGIVAATQRFVMRNNNLVGENEITSYRDLLNPKWKGKKITINDPTIPGGGSSFSAVLAQDWGMDGARDFFKELVKQEPVITRDANGQLVDLAQGKYALAISPRVEVAAQMIATGAPVSFVKVKDAIKIGSMGSGGLALPTRPPHPNARKLFVNWLLTKEGQEVFSRQVGLPSARKDVSKEGINATFFPLPDEKIIIEDEDHFNLQGTMLDVAREAFAPLLK